MSLPGHGGIFPLPLPAFFKEDGVYCNEFNALMPYPEWEKDGVRGKARVTAENATIWLTLFHKMIWLRKNSIRLQSWERSILSRNDLIQMEGVVKKVLGGGTMTLIRCFFILPESTPRTVMSLSHSMLMLPPPSTFLTTPSNCIRSFLLKILLSQLYSLIEFF